MLEFEPTKNRSMWTYATCCMSAEGDDSPVELYMFSATQDRGLVELLTAAASYHRNNAKLDLSHTVNFGQPWQKDSPCTYGFISLPYLDGPDLEHAVISGYEREVQFYWLIPVTEAEVDFKKSCGVEALEIKFEESGFDYLNPNRASVV
ncbi:suppressor of fused domain protein [Chryseolinea lacunae]